VGAEEVLGDLLRDGLGYRGLVISVAAGIRNLLERHRVAADLSDAAVQALTAGVDIDLAGSCFREELPVAVADGSVSEEALDRAVRRVLQCKFQCGLFDRGPVADSGEPVAHAMLAPSFEASAASLHEAATVLLKNSGGVLPLAAGSVLRVADAPGAWLMPALQAQNFIVVQLDPGQALASPPDAQTDQVAIVCMGASAAPTVRSEQTSTQLQLLDQLAQQGVPTVVILNADAVDQVSRLPESVSAILIAWDFTIGPMRAAAAVLTGVVNPSGRLPLALRGAADSGSDAPQGYCFGHGLSYSHFEYRQLLCADAVDTHGAVEVAIEVVNESTRNGVEVVQLYCHDPVAETSRPQRQLIGFHRLALAAGQSKRVVFQLDVSQFAYYNRRLEYVVEPGVMTLLAGASSGDIRARARLILQGEIRIFKQQQRLATQSRELELSP
jgi:hypothetical protein